jgi:hypothetical protein
MQIIKSEFRDGQIVQSLWGGEGLKLNTRHVTGFIKFCKYLLVLGRRPEKLRTHVIQFLKNEINKLETVLM